MRTSAVQFGIKVCAVVAVALLFGHAEARAGYVAVRGSAATEAANSCDKDLTFESASARSFLRSWS